MSSLKYLYQTRAVGSRSKLGKKKNRAFGPSHASSPPSPALGLMGAFHASKNSPLGIRACFGSVSIPVLPSVRSLGRRASCMVNRSQDPSDTPPLSTNPTFHPPNWTQGTNPNKRIPTSESQPRKPCVIPCISEHKSSDGAIATRTTRHSSFPIQDISS